MQVIYQIISAYFEDDCADELTNEPVMTAIPDKDALTSQPTLSRFFNRMDEDTLHRFDLIIRELRKVIYSIKRPEFLLFDIDSTLLDTYGNQEGEDNRQTTFNNASGGVCPFLGCSLPDEVL